MSWPVHSAAAMTPLLHSLGRARRLALTAAQGGYGPPCPGGPIPPGAPGGNPGADACICQRPHAFVLCHVCGWYSRCRLMRLCRQHPNTRFLLDMTVCPRCHAPSYQMAEYDMGEVNLPPCQLPMPEPSRAHGQLGRPTSPDSAEASWCTGVGVGGGASKGAAGGSGSPSPAKGQAQVNGTAKAGGSRARMRPPLQSDSQGMQRKLRDRFCLQCLPRTPSGLPLSMFSGEGSGFGASEYGGAAALGVGGGGGRKRRL